MATDARRVKPPLEKVEQAGIVKLVRQLGGQVWVLGTRRKGTDYQGTMQTPGLPDLWIALPARPNAAWPRAFWFEVKRIGGARTPDQVAFGDSCMAAGVGYAFGTCADFAEIMRLDGRLR